MDEIEVIIKRVKRDLTHIDAERRERLERIEEEYRTKIGALRGTLSYYEQLKVNTLASEAGVSLVANGTQDVPSSDGSDSGDKSGPSPEERQRLPKGFIEDRLYDFCEREDRFWHIQEAADFIQKAIDEAYPGHKHLDLNRGSLNRTIKRMYDDGELARARYGDSSHNFFHGLPHMVTRSLGGWEYASEHYEPPRRLLPEPLEPLSINLKR